MVYQMLKFFRRIAFHPEIILRPLFFFKYRFINIRKSAKRGHCTHAEQECYIMTDYRNIRKLPKHKLSQNAKNFQYLLKFGLIEDNVTVFSMIMKFRIRAVS